MPREAWKPTSGQWFKPPPCIHCQRKKAVLGFSGRVVHERDIESIARNGSKQARFCSLKCALEYALNHTGDQTWCYDCGDWIYRRDCKHLRSEDA